MTALDRAYRAWNAFWFEADSSAQMRLFRKLFSTLLLVNYAQRAFDLELFFSDRGIAPLAALPEIMDLRYRFSLLYFFSGTGALWFFYGLLMVSLGMLLLGRLPRLAAVVALVIHVSLLHRNMASSYGVDTISTFFLLFLCLSDFRIRVPEAPDFASTLGSVAYRLSQIQLCIIYLYSGIHKLKGVTWWSGEAIWSVLANAQMARFDFSWLSHFPLVLVVATYVSLIWEIYFPALIWVPAVRRPALIFGALFHIGIGIAINIPVFAALMVVIYSLFLEPREALAFEKIFKKISLSPISPMSGAERNFGGYSRPGQLD